MAEGDGSSRNFRSAYYEKLGFCGNEDKSILDMLVSASTLDSEKLSDLCERFELDRRSVEAWKILLGVECGRRNPFGDHENVKRIRTEHFQSLKHHLEVLLRHNVVIKRLILELGCNDTNSSKQDKATSADEEVENRTLENETEIPSQVVSCEDLSEHIESNPGKLITLMYLLEVGRLESPNMTQNCKKLYAMASFFADVTTDLQEAFFLFRNFIKKLEL